MDILKPYPGDSVTGDRRLKAKLLNLCSSESVNPEEDPARCKFVLIEWADEVHLVFGLLSQYPYHANLVARFCEHYRVPSGWERRPDKYALYAAGVRVRGGGYVTLDFAGRRVAFAGRSTAYGAYDITVLERVLADPGVFGGWQVVAGAEL